MENNNNKTNNEPDKPEPKKRPYIKPVLRELGTVRNLTHGGGCLKTYDGAIFKKRM